MPCHMPAADVVTAAIRYAYFSPLICYATPYRERPAAIRHCFCLLPIRCHTYAAAATVFDAYAIATYAAAAILRYGYYAFRRRFCLRQRQPRLMIVLRRLRYATPCHAGAAVTCRFAR